MQTLEEPQSAHTKAVQAADASDQEIVLRVAGLTKRYGERAVVQNLNLEVRRGEVFGFLGPNGAGKTTAIAMMLGLVQPHAGTIEILGHDVAHGYAPALKNVGAIVETPAYYPYLSGLDNLRVLALARGGAPAHRYDEVLTLVGLKGRERDRFGTYSLGMKQRLGVAGALLHQPELLILDEPSNGLDPAGMVEIRELILRLAGEGQTIVLCSHLLNEVQQVCDRVAILARGKLVAEGRIDTLLAGQEKLRLLATSQEALLAALGSRASRDGEGTLVAVTRADAPALLRALLGAGIDLVEARWVGGELEKFYLEQVGVADAG
jgi:ABC-2 type transport system ATP-binding protein